MQPGRPDVSDATVGRIVERVAAFREVQLTMELPHDFGLVDLASSRFGRPIPVIGVVPSRRLCG